MPLAFTDVVDRAVFSDAPFRWRVGVRSLHSEEWLQPDDRRDADLAEKRALTLARPEEVFAALPGSEAAASEVWTLVAADLRDRGLEPVESGVHPLERAGRSVQEDLCVLEPRDGTWMLTAGSVCFPTRWSLEEKIGATLRVIHDPVPGYAGDLAARVDRFFDRMTLGSSAARLNWSLVDDPSRRLEPHVRQAATDPPRDVGRDLHLRIERQTLRRLADHDAVVFGIRIHGWPLAEVIRALPGEHLATALDTMPLDIAEYKDLDGVRATVSAWAREHASR